MSADAPTNAPTLADAPASALPPTAVDAATAAHEEASRLAQEARAKAKEAEAAALQAKLAFEAAHTKRTRSEPNAVLAKAWVDARLAHRAAHARFLAADARIGPAVYAANEATAALAKAKHGAALEDLRVASSAAGLKATADALWARWSASSDSEVLAQLATGDRALAALGEGARRARGNRRDRSSREHDRRHRDTPRGSRTGRGVARLKDFPRCRCVGVGKTGRNGAVRWSTARRAPL